MKIFNVKSNDNFDNSKLEAVRPEKNNVFSGFLNGGNVAVENKTAGGSVSMNFLAQTLDASVIVSKVSKDTNVERDVAPVKDKHQDKPKEKDTVSENKNRSDDKRAESRDDVNDSEKSNDKPKTKDSEVKETSNNRTEKSKNNKEKTNNKDTTTNDVSNETVVGNVVQNLADAPVVTEGDGVVTAFEQALGTTNNIEDGTILGDDLLEEAAPSSKGNIGEAVTNNLKGEGENLKGDITKSLEQTGSNQTQANVETTQTQTVGRQDVKENVVVLSKDNKPQNNNLGVELADMSESSITDTQAEALSEVIGKDIKANVKVEVKDNTSKQPLKQEAVASTVVNFNEKIEAQTKSDKKQEITERSSLAGIKMTQSSEQMADVGSESNSNAMAEGQKNVSDLTGLVVANSGKTPTETFAETLKQASTNIGNVTKGENKNNAQANDNVQGLTSLAKTEKAEEVAPKTPLMAKQKPSAVTEQIKVSINKAMLKDADNIKIQLRPKELGRIDVKMEINSEGKLSATISASRPETLDILQRDVRNLEKAFNDAGFKTDSGSLSFNFKGGQPNGQEQSRNNNGFAALNNEDVIENLTTATDFADYSLTGNGKGVNIRV